MNHLLTNNPQDWDEENPFRITTPSLLSNVPCEPPDCPLTPQQITILDLVLAEKFDTNSRSMMVRRAIWEEALILCNNIWHVLN